MRGKRLLPGFGFWELIVVLAAIMIVAAIVWPIFRRDQHSDHYQSRCINNLKQITTAFLMYCQGNDECFPVVSHTDKVAWSSYLSGVDPKVFDCPASKSKGSDITPDYGYNGALGRNAVGGKRYGAALGDIKYPSLCPSVADVAHGGPHTGGGKLNNYAIYDWDAEIDIRHDNGAMFGFVDGHAQWVNFTDQEKIAGSRLGFMLTKQIDPYAFCGTILYWFEDGVIKTGKGERSQIEDKLFEPLPSSANVGVTGEICVSDWSAVHEVSLKLRDGHFRSFFVTLDSANLTVEANGRRSSAPHGKQLQPDKWYRLSAYALSGSVYPGRLYATLNGDGDTCLLRAQTSAPAVDRAGIYVEASAKGYVKYRNVCVSRYDVP